MEYEELATIYHKDSTSSRDSRIRTLAKNRRDAESSFRLGYTAAEGELFIAVPRELSMLHEKVLRRERKVSALLRSMPGIAGHAILRSLVLDEVVSSNGIEGVHSTRKQIRDALMLGPEGGAKRRFRELATLYMDIADGSAVMPSTPEDVRAIYDRIMDGEISKRDWPDGRLFRAGGVDIVNERGKVLHRGLEPEERIVHAVQSMLLVASSEELPALFSAIASHYLFEYAHPFYDGNGRMGRYLLALYLSVPLSMATSLSLSRVISENRRAYYKAFASAQNPLNCGELTHYVYQMLELVSIAQSGMLQRLESANDAYGKLEAALCKMTDELHLKQKETEVLFLLMQQEVFGMFGDVPLSEIAEHIGLKEQRTRQYLASLEQSGFVVKARGRNPVTFALGEEFRNRYGIEHTWQPETEG